MNRPTGLVLGKFYPPHNGHHLLIDTAEDWMDVIGGDLIVLVGKASHETIPLDERIWLLRDRHPNVTVWGCVDDNLIDYNDPEIWEAHLGVWTRALDDTKIDYVFSSEGYGPELATRLGASHVMVDLERLKVPISATMVRGHPDLYWECLAPATKAYLAKRIVVIGAESSGTTTLAQKLANIYGTVCVPEWGRLFSEALPQNHKWTTDDFELIAENQMNIEDDLSRCCRSGLVICDTDLFATQMFHELYIGGRNSTVQSWLEQRRDDCADLYIITSHEGVPFEQDGTRLFGTEREWMTQWLINSLPHDKTIVVEGSPAERIAQALEEIRTILHWDFPAPLG